jgi:hypothetical protein
VRDIDAGQLGAPERPGQADKRQRPVAQAIAWHHRSLGHRSQAGHAAIRQTLSSIGRQLPRPVGQSAALISADGDPPTQGAAAERRRPASPASPQPPPDAPTAVSDRPPAAAPIGQNRSNRPCGSRTFPARSRHNRRPSTTRLAMAHQRASGGHCGHDQRRLDSFPVARQHPIISSWICDPAPEPAMKSRTACGRRSRGRPTRGVSRFRNFSIQAAAELDDAGGWQLDYGVAPAPAEQLPEHGPGGPRQSGIGPGSRGRIPPRAGSGSATSWARQPDSFSAAPRHSILAVWIM